MATKKTTRAKASTQKPSTPKHIGLVKHDPYLEPYEDAICGRQRVRTLEDEPVDQEWKAVFE